MSLLRASATEFRLRYLVHGVVYTLGFLAPWNRWLHLDAAGPNSHVWGLLSATLAMSVLPVGAGGITAAFNGVLVLGIAFAAAGAGLRTWGSAYLGANVVHDGQMLVGSAIVADGPYRHLRNPLYLGTFLHTLALALLMPVSGAVFAIVLIGWIQVRLALGEEAFLRTRLGAPYEAYCALVPRFWPSLRPRTASTGRAARWPQAFADESYFWGVAATFAFFGWEYNAFRMVQGVIVSLGVSVVLRAILKRPVRAEIAVTDGPGQA